MRRLSFWRTSSSDPRLTRIRWDSGLGDSLERRRASRPGLPRGESGGDSFTGFSDLSFCGARISSTSKLRARRTTNGLGDSGGGDSLVRAGSKERSKGVRLFSGATATSGFFFSPFVPSMNDAVASNDPGGGRGGVGGIVTNAKSQAI